MPAADPHPELLAPAGSWDCARAAVAAGADAIYFGLPKHNARLRADNFTDEDLPELMAFLHAHGVKGFVAMNTLIFPAELEGAIEQLRRLESSGVDAAIIQDLGLARLCREVAPSVELHASTQMTITSPEGLRFVERLFPLERAVLARELSIGEIRRFSRHTEALNRRSPAPDEGPASALPVTPLEVFVHGALCVAWSGQCLTSESLGQRSANRGECAQACRMPYELVVDGVTRPLGEVRYLLSPQDLAAVDLIPQLVAAGVKSFKIEGRLKSPEYVTAVTRVYRKALDQAIALQGAADGTTPQPSVAGEPLPAPAAGRNPQAALISARDRYALEMTFSRGLTHGWLDGTNHPRLVHGRWGKKRGTALGEILRVGEDWVELAQTPAIPLRPGDGVVFDAGEDRNEEQGGQIWLVDPRNPRRIRFHRKAGIDFRRVRPGHALFKTSDPRLESELRSAWQQADLRPAKVALSVHASGRPGEPLRLRARPAGSAEPVEVDSLQPLQAPQQHALDGGALRAQLGRLGDTPYELAELTVDLPEPAYLPVSGLNRLRRALVEALARRPEPAAAPATLADSRSPRQVIDALSHQLGGQASRPPRGGPPAPAGPDDPSSAPRQRGSAALQATPGRVDSDEARRRPDPLEGGTPSLPCLAVLVRSEDQLAAALEARVPTIYADFEDPRRYKDAVARVRAGAAADRGSRILLATPRILKPGESGYLKQIARCEPDGVLIRNLGALEFFRDRPDLLRVGDFSLNVANALTAAQLRATGLLDRLTVSYDLNASQVLDLLHSAPPDWFELTLHQHMPMFHMEHCVFCTFLSAGTSYRDCGRPCETHEVHLRDRVGQLHRLTADVGCRNTLFNGRAQSGARFWPAFREAGLGLVRLELLDESRERAAATIRAYQRLLAGESTPDEHFRRIQASEKLGVTEGTLVSLEG